MAMNIYELIDLWNVIGVWHFAPHHIGWAFA